MRTPRSKTPDRFLFSDSHKEEPPMFRQFSRTSVVASVLGFMLALFPSLAGAQYTLINLVSNQSGAAEHSDPLLVNAWGLTYGPGGPFWISDNGSGWSTLYTGVGVKQGLQVSTPTAGGNGPGSPTGIVFNGSQDFQVQGWPAIFLFATLDGTISGWAPQSNLNDAIVGVTTPGAVYTGLAITSNSTGNFLFAADVANNKVDVFDGTFKLVTSFTDATLPAGFAPFGIQDFGGLLYVSFASTSGGTGGYIDIYSEGGVFLKRVAEGFPLNQPWGFAIAPKNFGPLSNTLLVSTTPTPAPSTLLTALPDSLWARSRTLMARISSSISCGESTSVAARRRTATRTNFSLPPVRTTTWLGPSARSSCNKRLDRDDPSGPAGVTPAGPAAGTALPSRPFANLTRREMTSSRRFLLPSPNTLPERGARLRDAVVSPLPE